MLSKGNDLATVSKRVDHSEVETTARYYTAVQVEEFRKRINSEKPYARLIKG
ncbi:MAG: hypothetical protein WAM24_04145 [Ignavibacteriaceae bacterium]